ncbi:MAG: LytTR family transcriptional regulator DNA-binding domain-containing protein [Streptosporangiales bacterium]|nr:LytTR family transcriptional regulator DNA-binding domain-containing protein [Streptosporangiales bacterium]
MNGTEEPTSGAELMTSGAASVSTSLRRTSEARERFAAGADSVRGVRPEILMSWYRCREEYKVNPGLERAPAAAETGTHAIEHDAMFAELGGLASVAAREVDGLDGVVTVADADGRILAAWGDGRCLDAASECNLAPWSSWSEWASGTNGMGTALESHSPVLVRGPEHWCSGFHTWTCAGVSVRDVVTDDPLAVLNISCPGITLPDTVLPWLRGAAEAARTKLRMRAQHSGTQLAAAFSGARLPAGTALAAVDPAGKVVLANEEAAALLGTPADTPAYSPPNRWTPQIPTVPGLVRQVVQCARTDPKWTGATQIFVPFLGSALPVAARPVLSGVRVIGALLAFGTADGGVPASFGGTGGVTTASGGPAGTALGPPVVRDSPPGGTPRVIPVRVVALRDDRWVLLDPREIRYAEADQNKVWLTSDAGRLLAATRGLDHLERQLEGRGFMRIHRRFLVNLGRVREIEQGFKGTLFVTTDTHTHETVPVARRHAAQLRQALGMLGAHSGSSAS